MSETRWNSVKRDLQAFSDLGSDLEVSERRTRMEFDLRRQGQSIVGSVEYQNSLILVQLEDSNDKLAYHEFLASERMANLDRLARQTTLLERDLKRRSKKELTKRRESVVLYNCFVPQQLSYDGRRGGTPGLAALGDLASDPASGGTRIVFLSAEAGQGKSSLLDVFTIRQAEKYRRGESSRLCLYVDAQGRGLARLDEAIARQLNDLQFMLSYSAVVSLVREGLVTLVVDGFDELIGSRGTYDDAFGSLSNFIEILEGRGTVIAATRSSYFNQEFGSRGSLLDAEDDLAYELMLVELLPWDRKSQTEYFERVVTEAALDRASARKANREFRGLQEADDAGLLSRPLFARDLSLLVVDEWAVDDRTITNTPQVVALLADSYIDREVQTKLLTRDRAPVMSRDQLSQYYVEIADEMWRLETREIDSRTLRELLDLWIEAWHLTTEGSDLLRARHAYLPFLVSSPLAKSSAFEHEVFFSYFLAKSLAPQIATGSSGIPQSLLSKATLDSVAAEFLAAELVRAGGTANSAIRRLCDVAAVRHPREAQVRLNCGSIIAAILRSHARAETPTSVDKIENVDLAGDDLSGINLHVDEINNVEVARCDLTGSIISVRHAFGLNLRDPLISADSTRLSIGEFDAKTALQGVRVATESGIQSEYDSAKLASTLQQVGLVETDEVKPLYELPSEYVEHVASLARAYEQLNPIGTKHDRHGHLLSTRDRVPRNVFRALEEHGLIAETHKQASGPPQLFYRKRFVPSRLMDGLWAPSDDPKIDAFWRELSVAAAE